MRANTWVVAALGLASLVVLLALSVVAASRKAQDIYVQLAALNEHHRLVEANLRRLRSDVNLSGIFVRDYLLDVEGERAPEYRDQIAQFRRTNQATLEELKTLVGEDDQIRSLQAKLTEYWLAFEPLFGWTTAEKLSRSAEFLQSEVVPRREAALSLARQVEDLNNANLITQSNEVARSHTAFRADLRRLLWHTVLLGLGVAIVVVLRLRVLEQRSVHSEHQMRDLSRRLVSAQEEERANLSRELHDDVAQVLTALRMELGRIERLDPAVAPAVAEARQLVDRMFQTVRDLAQGLRPSMLDDLGLQAALEWHVRDFAQRYGTSVDLTMTGDFKALPERYRTCAYRVVQEALTNCARHARAQRIEVAVERTARSLDVSVTDDGVGLEPGRRTGGLGLRGIEERVKELGGSLTVGRGARGGTVLAAHLRLPAGMTEGALARAAG